MAVIGFWCLAMEWDDYEEIAEALLEKYRDVNPINLAFPKLLEMIMALEGFVGKAEGNLEGKMERVIEIWYQEYQIRSEQK
ncbi:MAG: Fe-S cluster assembly protein IscX [Candidatus Bathyarchaeia archaeon]